MRQKRVHVDVVTWWERSSRPTLGLNVRDPSEGVIVPNCCRPHYRRLIDQGTVYQSPIIVAAVSASPRPVANVPLETVMEYSHSLSRIVRPNRKVYFASSVDR